MKQIFTLFAFLILANTVSAQAATDKKITITNFSAYAKDAKLILEWATDGTVPTYNWEIQRSYDGQEFSTIAWVLGAEPGKSADNYHYKENVKNAKMQTVYYRLRHTDENGGWQVSEIISTSTK